MSKVVDLNHRFWTCNEPREYKLFESLLLSLSLASMDV